MRAGRLGVSAFDAIVSVSLSCWLLVGAPSRARTGESVEVGVRGIEVDPASNSPVVILESKTGHKALPIWVGVFEAQAIAMELEGIAGPRPLTHDLMKRIVEELGAQVEHVVIDDLRGGTYFATIQLRGRNGISKIDSRPSDAIALALRFGKPILVNEKLFAGVEGRWAEPAVEVARLWGLTLQDVTAPLADSLGLIDTDGVLVSDVAPDAAASAVRRGDVIRKIHGQPVRSLADLRAAAALLEHGTTVRLGLMRERQSVLVRFKEAPP